MFSPSRNIPALAVLLIAGFFSTFSFADVRVFQPGKKPFDLADDLQIHMAGSGRFNRGLAAHQVLSLLKKNASVFGLEQIDGETLPLRGSHGSRSGFSMRFVQRHDRVHIEGAELVAIFGSKGELSALNSSLIPAPRLSVQPSISRQEALRIAARRLGYRQPELGEGFRDGLLIVRDRAETPVLVWQFSLRERENASKPALVQVIANGKRAGRIHKVLNLTHAKAPISIYDASVTLVVPNPIYKGIKVLENGKETFVGKSLVSTEARKANENLERTSDFYSNFFRRDSYDGNNAEINASVNVQKFAFLDVLGMAQNAAWMGPWKMFVFGAGGDQLGNFASSLDVVGHEFTHAVIETTSALEYQSQSGALNEHFADVFGAIVQEHYEHPSNPFLIGESVLRGELKARADALRDMLYPERGLSPQPTTVREIPAKLGKGCVADSKNDNCGVHILSGIPNRAAALIIQRVGWRTSYEFFYRVMTQRLRSNSDFSDYGNQLLDECRGDSLPSGTCSVVEQALAAVEIR